MGSSISGMGGQKKAYGMKQIPVRRVISGNRYPEMRKSRNAAGPDTPNQTAKALLAFDFSASRTIVEKLEEQNPSTQHRRPGMKSQRGFQVLQDRTPKYTVKEVAEIMDLSPYTIRYYDNIGLIPEVDRSRGNIRLFSDHCISWLKLVHSLRATGLPVEGVRHYIEMCRKGDSTIPERAKLIFRQEKILREELRNLRKQMEVLKYKKNYYKTLLATGRKDRCNPRNSPEDLREPEIVPQK